MKKFYRSKSIFYGLLALYLVTRWNVLPKPEGETEMTQGIPFSAVAAKITDQYLPQASDSKARYFAGSVKARLVSCVVFPIFAVMDVAYYGTKALTEFTVAHLEKDALAAERFNEDAWRCARVAERSFVGILGTPFSLFHADFVTRHFVPDFAKTDTIRSGGKLYEQRAKRVEAVDKEHVQRIVKDAIATQKRVSVIGGKWSQGRQALPTRETDIAIDMRRVNDVTIEGRIARVGAGATWRDVQAEANRHRLAVQVMQASNIFSVGGSLSANCHGWDHHAGILSNTVQAITIVDAQGEMIRLTPEDELFGYVIGGWGGFGVIVEAEIELTDNVPLIDKGEPVALEDYADHVREMLADDQVVMQLGRLSLDRGNLLQEVVSQYYETDPARPDPVVSELVDEGHHGTRFQRVALNFGRGTRAVINQYWRSEQTAIVTPTETTRNEVTRAPIMAMMNNSEHDSEWLQEFFLPLDQLAPFVRKLGELLDRNDVTLINGSLRYVCQDPHAKMGYAAEGERIAVVLCWNQPLGDEEVAATKEWVSEAIDLTLDHGGSYYLPYQQFATPEQFAASYPNADEVRAKKEEVDPDGVFHNGLWEQYLTPRLPEQEETTVLEDFQTVFRDPALRVEFADFLNNIFLQLDEDRFFALVDSVMRNAASHEELYQELAHRIGEAKANAVTTNLRAIRSLRGQKGAVGEQAAELLGDAKINGVLEVGFSGRMTSQLKKECNLKGRVVAMSDGQFATDYIEAGFPLPYNEWLPLTYEPIGDEMESRSVDLAVIPIGLHHAPEERLPEFVRSLARVTRVGGSVLLRDHDAETDEMKALVNVVHSVFNAATGVSWQEERNEVRNFQGMRYWDELMQAHGFTREGRAHVRHGDPTANSLVRYIKTEEASRQLTEIKAELRSDELERQQMQTFMTAIEWHSVAMSQDYARYLEGQPPWKHPYFGHIKLFWKAFSAAWSEARRYHSAGEIMKSSYFLMDTFMAVFHTVEYTAKGVLYAPVSWMSAPDHAHVLEKKHEIAENYGNYIETIPFYNYDYFSRIKEMWSALAEDWTELKAERGAVRAAFSTDLAKELFVAASDSAELVAKGVISKPMAYFYSEEENQDATHIDLIVRTDEDLETLHGLAQERSDKVPTLETFGQVSDANAQYKRIKLPRYLPFRDIVMDLAVRGVEVVSVADQERIQVKLAMASEAELESIPGTRVVSEYSLPSYPTEKIVNLNVATEELTTLLAALAGREDIEVRYLHDF